MFCSVFFIQPSCNTPQQLRSQANIYRLRRGGFFPVLAKVNLLSAKSPSQPIYSPGPPGDELANVPSDFWPSHWPPGPPHHPPPSQWISAGWAPMREISSFTAALIFYFFSSSRSHVGHVPTKCVFRFSKSGQYSSRRLKERLPGLVSATLLLLLFLVASPLVCSAAITEFWLRVFIRGPEICSTCHTGAAGISTDITKMD